MSDTLTHRGPDQVGTVFLKDGLLALGQRRLAIVDLSSSGSMPMFNEDRTLCLVFNGEIYNFASLRSLLESRGHRFSSQTDGEVILHGYEEWGLRVLEKLEGMFAFGLYDQTRCKLILARDRFGMKPLYYSHLQDRFLFGSEPASLLAQPHQPRRANWNALMDFLVLRFIPAPETAWEGIYKLPPGCFLEFAEGGTRVQRYYEVGPGKKNGEILDGLRDSLSSHLIGDVPIGLFLSGGLDSSTLAFLLKEQGLRGTESFTVGFKNWWKSEHLQARNTANAAELTGNELLLGSALRSGIDAIASVYDEPLGGTSTVPTMALCQVASKRVKVVLAGDGGDELFAGYDRYQDLLQYDNPSRDQVLECYAKALKWKNLGYGDANALFDQEQTGKIEKKDPHWLYKREWQEGLEPVTAMQILDYRVFLPEIILSKVDRAAMACSLEVRMPFLDHNLVESVLAHPSGQYIEKGKSKVVLRNFLHSQPQMREYCPKKQGFGAPLKKSFAAGELLEIIENGNLVRNNILRRGFFAQRRSFGDLWPIFLLEKWWTKWFEPENNNACMS